MADQQRRSAGDQFPEFGEKLIFSIGIERAGRLVKDDEAGIAEEGAGNDDFLPLAVAQLHTVLEPAAEHGVVTAGQGFDQLIGAGLAGGGLDGRQVVEVVDITEADVFLYAQLVFDKILKDDADLAADVFTAELTQIDTFQRDGAVGGVIEPAEQFHQGALAGAVGADQGDHFLRADGQRQAGEDFLVMGGVAEMHVLQFDAFLAGGRQWCGLRRVADGVLHIEKGEEVGDEEVVLVEAGDVLQHPFQGVEAALEGLEVHDHVADGDQPLDGTQADQQETAHQDEGGKGLGGEIGKAALLCQAELLAADQCAQVAEGADEERAEAEEA